MLYVLSFRFRDIQVLLISPDVFIRSVIIGDIGLLFMVSLNLVVPVMFCYIKKGFKLAGLSLV